jgi:hypothetical protein
MHADLRLKNLKGRDNVLRLMQIWEDTKSFIHRSTKMYLLVQKLFRENRHKNITIP